MTEAPAVSDKDNFRTEIRQWLETHCPPAMRQPIVPDEMVWSGTGVRFHSSEQRAWFEACRDKGYFAPGWPREYGGAGLPPALVRVFEEEMARLGCRQPQYNLGVWMLGPVLLEVGTHQQKLEHLWPMMRGERRWCQGFSEPNAGSDLASLKTAARLDEAQGCYLVNGSKIWTSDGDKADWMYALVRTDPGSRKQQGISFVMIDMRDPGVTVKPIELISGRSHFCQVFFDNVRVPLRQVVGQAGEGWAVAKKLLQHERAAMAKFSEGGAPTHDALAVARRHLFDAEGRPVAPELRDRLAAVLMDAQAFALTSQRLKELMLARQDVSGLAAIMKLVQTEQEVAKYELLEQVLGLRGLAWEGEDFSAEERELCRAWLNTKTYTIGGGTSEIQLNIIAKRVLGLPG